MCANIVIPLVRSSYGDCEELRYALCSIEQNLLDDFSITIIGYKPSWIKGVTHIPFCDCSCFVARNQINKLILASSMYDSFIEWHDDVFLIRPVSYMDVVKPYYLEVFDDDEWGKKYYQKQLRKGYRKIKRRLKRKTIYNFATHTPKMYENDKVMKTVEMYGLMEEPIMFFENFYLNTFLAGDLESVHKHKIGVYDENAQINESALDGRTFVNFDESGAKSGIFDVVMEKFKTKSSFEL